MSGGRADHGSETSSTGEQPQEQQAHPNAVFSADFAGHRLGSPSCPLSPLAQLSLSNSTSPEVSPDSSPRKNNDAEGAKAGAESPSRLRAHHRRSGSGGVPSFNEIEDGRYVSEAELQQRAREPRTSPLQHGYVVAQAPSDAELPRPNGLGAAHPFESSGLYPTRLDQPNGPGTSTNATDRTPAEPM
jgi:hypothetical protein